MNEIKIPDAVDVEWAKKEMERTGGKKCNRNFVWYVKRDNDYVDWVDLNNLSKKGSKINWLESNKKHGKIVYSYKHRRGEMLLKEVENKRIKVSNMGEDFFIDKESVKNVRLGKVCKTWGLAIYESGQIVNENLEIIERVKSKEKGIHYKVKCLLTGEEYITVQDRLKRGSGSKFIKHEVSSVNWLYNEKHVLPYLKNIEESKKFMKKSDFSIDTVCLSCGLEKRKVIKDLTRNGYSCEYCSNKTSFPEKTFMSYLITNKIKYEHQKRIKHFPYIYDFYLEDSNILVEVQGAQHTIESSGYYNGTLEEQKIIDSEKEKIARLEGFEYVVVDARYSDFDYLFRQFRHAGFLITNELDIKCYVNKLNPDVENIIKDYIKGVKQKDLVVKYRLSRTIITNILKRNNVWAPRKNSKKVVCKNTGIVYDSMIDACKWAGLKSSVSIKNCLKKGKGYSAGKHPDTGEKLYWEYVD